MQTQLGLSLPDLPDQPAGQDGRRRQPKAMAVTGAELADFLGVTAPAVTQLKKSGVLATDEDGRYDLRDSVRAYCSQLRQRKTPKGEQAVNLEASLAFWKVENEKQKNLQWRVRYGQSIGSAILAQLANAVSALRSELSGDSAACAAVRSLQDAIGRVDLDDAVYSTLNEANDEELGGETGES